MAAPAPRPDAQALAALAGLSAATVHEAMGGRGALPARIRPLDRDMRVCGPARPVLCPRGDNLMLHTAIAEAQAGDVLVVDHEAAAEDGPFGDILAAACRARGVVGLVIDGCVRDAAALRAMGFPVFCIGVCLRGTAKDGGGAVGRSIRLGDVVIHPGDVVLGDEDGVVIVPADEAGPAAAAARARDEAEERLRRALARGATTLDLLDLRPRLGSSAG
jgi:4-hydroxy-4-methyl-2-oxoglutarate aldolase